jgi:uncharacterized membrane protein YdjX (TVP38/TMEM64 family)
MKTLTKIFILIASVLIFVVGWKFLGFNEIITVEKLQAHNAYFQAMVADNYLLSAFIFIAVFAALIAAALPVSPPLTLLGSYLFGFVPGFLFSFTACMIGAISSFLVVRYVVKRWLSSQHTERVEKFNEQFKKYGSSYLLMLHFLSVIPYIIITILAALAEVPLRVFVWTTAVGSVPLLALYSWAARELASLGSFKDIFSARVLLILGILFVLAVLPIFLRRFKHRFGL